ncbi:MAG: hypothetical protein F4X44_00685 [Gammaproteobacteria bacterium]|nr:hypothetical protein [Gammaproteobacteria bacterium]
MSFFNLSPLLVGLGLLALAGLLFLLQQLRIRYTELPVATTMFWAAAVREAPVRVLRQRFRHILAYLLALLICWLLWIGFGGPLTGAQRTAGFNILVLDGSAHASTGDIFQQSKNQLLNDVSKYSRDSREVFLSGAQNVRVLAPGEEKLVLERRLEEFEPVAARSSIDELLRLLPRNNSYPTEVNVVVYGGAPISEHALDRLPAGYRVARRFDSLDDFENRGIVALGIGEPLSGEWDKVDVLFRILADGLSVNSEDFRVQIGDQDLATNRLESISPNEFRVRDVVADGSVFSVAIEEPDDLAFDNEALVTLPTKERVSISIGEDVPTPIRRAIDADAGIEIVGSGASVAVLGPNDSETSIPYLRTTPIVEQSKAFVIGYSGELEGMEALHQSVADLGLAEIDSAAMATELNQDISVQLDYSDVRYVSVWSELVSESFNFKDSMSFPIFISKSIRYLANQEPWYAYLAAGRQPVEQTSGSSLASSDLLAEYAIGASYVRNEAGTLELRDGTSLQVSLLDPAAAVRTGSQNLTDAAIETSNSQTIWGIATWLALLAVLLLGLEWYLYQRGLMP